MDDKCVIIRDLLPNYIEKLTNEKTNIYIEEHLRNCNECNKIYESMKKELNLYTANTNKKDINYLKKYKNKIMILKIILFMILMIFILIIGRKFIIISNLSNKVEEISMNSNYYISTVSYENDEYTKSELYRMEDKCKVITTKIKDEQITKKEIYSTKKEIDKYGNIKYNANVYTEENGNKTADLNKEINISSNLTNSFYAENNWQLLLYSMPATIKSTTYNGEECYYISNFKSPYSYTSEGMYVSKKTGLLISMLSYEIENADIGETERWPGMERKYKFNIVTENDFIEPSIEEYNIND